MQKKYLYLGTGLAAILVFWYAFGSTPTESTDIFTTVKKGSFDVTVTTTGELRAKNSTSIRGPEGIREFRIFNVTIQRLVPEGTVVSKGDFVAELDRSEVSSSFQDAQLEVEEARSQLELARLDSSLTLSQARDNLINLEFALEEYEIAVEQSQYESPATQRQAQINLDRARRELEQAQKNYETRVKQAEANIREIETELRKQERELNRIKELLDKFTIYAPENGMVIYKRNRDGSKVTEGSSISAWSPVVAELPDFSIMESVTYVNEVDIQKVKVGQTVEIGLDAMPEKKLSGVVTDVANIGEQRPNSNSKVFQVKIRVNETDNTLRPAMTTSNLIYVESLDDTHFVPLETIHTVDSLSYVFKRDGLETVMQQVILGIMNDNDVVIKEGLQQGERVYLSMPDDTTGIRKLKLPAEVLQNYRDEDIKRDLETDREEGVIEETDSVSGEQQRMRLRREGAMRRN